MQAIVDLPCARTATERGKTRRLLTDSHGADWVKAVVTNDKATSASWSLDAKQLKLASKKSPIQRSGCCLAQADSDTPACITATP